MVERVHAARKNSVKEVGFPCNDDEACDEGFVVDERVVLNGDEMKVSAKRRCNEGGVGDVGMRVGGNGHEDGERLEKSHLSGNGPYF